MDTENRKVIIVLAAILAVACLIVGIVLSDVYHSRNYLPDSSVRAVTEYLEKNGIEMDANVMEKKQRKSAVYLCDSEQYSETVAGLLGGEPILVTYETPDGEILKLADGTVMEFGEAFSFHYLKGGYEEAQLPDFETESGKMRRNRADEIEEAVTSFLDRGSQEFVGNGQVKVHTAVEQIVDDGEVAYARCTRSLDGVTVNDNSVICVYRDGMITEAVGTWCFLTEGKSYFAQLSDLVNILFSVRKDIQKTSGETVRITSIDVCYSLYYYEGGSKFCLIPCWQITTDRAETLIYNGLDSTLYTNK